MAIRNSTASAGRTTGVPSSPMASGRRIVTLACVAPTLREGGAGTPGGRLSRDEVAPGASVIARLLPPARRLATFACAARRSRRGQRVEFDRLGRVLRVGVAERDTSAPA